MTFGFELRFGQQRTFEHVEQKIDRHVGVAGGHARVERSVLVGGEGVHVATHTVHRQRYGTGVALCGPLEQQMFEEVRGAGQFI
ncbi:MAG: hypothetical protein R2789_03355 [Microthrixaceae bacterium]